MKSRLAAGSLFLLGLSIFFLVALTAFESALAGAAPGLERTITFVLLVLPSAAGAALGLFSLVHREGRRGLAVSGLVLNTLFALFHLAILLFAG